MRAIATQGNVMSIPDSKRIDAMVDNHYQIVNCFAVAEPTAVKELPPPDDTELSDETRLDKVRLQLKANTSGKRYNPFLDR